MKKAWWIPDYESLRQREYEHDATKESKMRNLGVRFCSLCKDVYEHANDNGIRVEEPEKRPLKDFPSYGIIRRTCIDCRRKKNNENDINTIDSSNFIDDRGNIHCIQESSEIREPSIGNCVLD